MMHRMHKKTTTPLMAGLTTGVVLGAAAYMVIKNHNHPPRPGATTKAIRKQTGKALQTVGSVIENMAYLVQ